MIFPIILHHDSSKEYTERLVNKINRKYLILDSSKHNTSFTESFNLAIIKGIIQAKDKNYSHIMICNNDIQMDESDLVKLDNTIKGLPGIFSPVVNSPHSAVMQPKDGEDFRKVPWVEFVAPIFSVDTLIKTGVLDFKMSYGWGVELDYCYRALKNGYKTRLCQNIAIHHYGHKSQSDHGEYSHYANIEMNDRLREKYGDKWQEVLKYPQW